MVPAFDFHGNASYSCIWQRTTLIWHLFYEVFGGIHLLNRTETKYVPWLKLVAESYQSGNLLKAICIICRWKSNGKGILTDAALLSGNAVWNGMCYTDIISSNVVLQFKCLFLLQKKTHINKGQASTDIWGKIDGTSSFRMNQPSLFPDTGPHVGCSLLTEAEGRVVAPNTHSCLIFTCVPMAALPALVPVLSILQGTLLRTKSKAININDLNQEDSF